MEVTLIFAMVALLVGGYVGADNSPPTMTFPNDDTMVITYPENQPLGKLGFACIGTDPDDKTTANGTLSFSFAVGNQGRRFSLDASTCDLYLVQPFAYEVAHSYILFLQVSDGAGEHPHSPRKVTLNVLDKNSHAPSCSPSIAWGSLYENATVGSTFAKLKCTDLDTGQGGQFDFTVLLGNDATSRSDTIGVNGLNSMAYILRQVDYERDPHTFTAFVLVTDQGSPQLTSTSTTILTMEDIDDNMPIITPSSLIASVDENVELGHSITRIHATDADAPNTPASMITFESTCNPALVTIDRYSGDVITEDDIDWEQTKVIDCQIAAYSDPLRKSTSTVTVNVNNMNDGRPAFQKQFQTADVLENTAAGTTIAVVPATDPENDKITYTLEQSIPDIFDITSIAAVTIKTPPDYEKQTSYLLIITAKDDGKPSLNSTTMLQVAIKPVNEDSPVLTEPTCTGSVAEDASPGTTITAVNATDKDAGRDGAISFIIQSQNVPFFIDKSSGLIILAAKLDYEKITSYLVVILVRDNSTTKQSSVTQTCTIYVTDVKDQSVVCLPLDVLVIQYPFPIGKQVAQINCSVGNKTVPLNYAIKSVDDGTFELDPNTGGLQLKSIPKKQQYNVDITVTFGVDPTSITLIVLAEQELKMNITPDTITVREGDPGRILTTVQACCTFPQISFRLLSGNDDNRVTLTGSNGDLTLMVSYDYEYQAQYVYLFEATSDSGQTATGNLTVFVGDTNNNAPVFDLDIYHFLLDATLPPGSLIAKIQARDKDAGINADFDISIISGNTGNTFTLTPTGDFSLANAFDYDAVNSYTLKIEAKDKGSPPMTGYSIIVVTEQDNRNNTPQLIPTGNYTATLSEDCALGKLVFQLQADKSTPRFVYKIESGNINNVFQITPYNGIIRLVRYLDRETLDFYLLKLSATNEKGLSVFAFLGINVTDVNDNYPVSYLGVWVFSIPDQTKADVFVGFLNVTDPDLGPNGTVSLLIEDGNIAGAFKINGFDLQTNMQVNYPTLNMYRLRVRASDMGTPSRTTTFLVIVFILNGNIPYCNTNSDTISVLESKEVGSQVYDVNATDKGAKEDGNLIYSIQPTYVYLDIRPLSGQVVIVKALDYESPPQTITLTILVSNKGQPSLTFTFTLTVNVLDVNEFTPLFLQQSFSFSVKEDEKPNYYVGTVTATDNDLGPSGEVTLTWSGSHVFDINAQTGAITLKDSLAYLVEQYYQYIITATDRGVPVRRAMASVVINIIDANNYSPAFTSGTFVEVSDSVFTGSEIYQVHANDLDTGPRGLVSYEIKDPTQTFSINSTTGVIKTEAHLNAITTETYSVTVRAYDAGNPTLDNFTTITIKCIKTDPNYFDPSFSPTCPTSVTVPRKSSPGFVVALCPASDQDTGISGEVEHTIISGNTDGYFVIGTKSGIVTTATNLFTANNFYIIVLFARDLGKPQRNTTTTLNIAIAPAIFKDVKVDYNCTIPENAAVSTVVCSIIVDDGRTVSGYTISTGNYGDAFKMFLQGNDGQVVINNVLDSELYPVYALVIQATANDVDDLTITCAVYVTDVDDNQATFPYSTLKLQIPENSPIGTVMKILSLTDLDTDAVNKNNTLYIKPSVPCNIDQDGKLTLTSSLDYETQSHYDVTVYAMDNQGAFPTPVTVTISIDVIDVEEKEKVSTSDVTDSAVISLEVPHQAKRGDLFYTLKAGDFGLTPTQGAIIEFVAYKSISPCTIHPVTGDMTVDADLSYHTMYFMWVLIKVKDGSSVTNRTALIRIDTFDRSTEMIVIEFSESFSYVVNNILRFRHRTQAFFADTERVGFSNLLETSTSSRRRLLAQKSTAYTYVVKNTSADDMSNINEPKSFMTQQEMLDVLQMSRDGTPVIGLSDPSVMSVATVEPYEETRTDNFENFINSPAGIAVFCLLGLLLLVLIVLIATCIFYRKCRKNRRKSKKAEEKDTPKRKSFSRMSENPSFFNSSPQIIVSAPPPVTLHDPTAEKQPSSNLNHTEDTADNTPTRNNTHNNHSNNQDNTVNNNENPTNKINLKDPNVQSGLPSQYSSRSNVKTPQTKKGTSKVTNNDQSNSAPKRQSK